MKKQTTTAAKKSTAKKPAARKKTVSLDLPTDGSIPDFLLVKNRKPLTPEQQAAFDARVREQNERTRTDFHKPKGLSDEEWAALEAARAEERKAKSYERLARLHARRDETRANVEERKIARTTAATTGPVQLKKPPQEGSRKRQVYEAWVASGEDAAVACGRKLDLKDGTVRSWFGAWSRQAEAERATTAPTRAKDAPAAATTPVVVTDRHPRHDGKRRVYLRSDPEGGQGTVMTEGPEQSVIRWDNGNETVVINKWVETIQC